MTGAAGFVGRHLVAGLADLEAGRTTRGHRTLAPGPVDLEIVVDGASVFSERLDLLEATGCLERTLELPGAALWSPDTPHLYDLQVDLVQSLASQAAVAISNARLNSKLKQAYLDTILRLSVAAEYKDHDTPSIAMADNGDGDGGDQGDIPGLDIRWQPADVIEIGVNRLETEDLLEPPIARGSWS